MAGSKGDITANVGINVDGDGLDAVINRLQNRISALLLELGKIGDNAGSSNKKIAAKALKELDSLEGKIKALQKLTSQVNTLRGSFRDEDQAVARIEKAYDKLSKAKELQLMKGVRERVKAAEDSLKNFNKTLNDNDKEVKKQVSDLQSQVRETDRLESAYTKLNTTLSKNRRSEIAQGIKEGDQAAKDFDKTLKQIDESNKKIINDTLQQGKEADRLSKSYQRLDDQLAKGRRQDITRGIKDNEKALKDFDAQLSKHDRELLEETRAQNRLNDALEKEAKLRRDNLLKESRGFISDTNQKARTTEQQLKEPKLQQSPLAKSLNGLVGDGGLALAARVGIYATAASVVYSLINTVQDGAKFVLQFDDALAKLAAISGATGPEMDKLSSNILQVGRNSNQSILQLTEASTVLAQAGYTSNEIAALLKQSSDLAGASGVDAAQAVDVLTSTLGAFNLQVTEAQHVSDALVAVLNKSKLSIQQVQLGIQYAGAAAQENGVSFEELTAAIGAMADAGIKSGSTAGTGIRQFFADLQDPSQKLIENLKAVGLNLGDVNIKTRGLDQVLQTLNEHGFDGTGLEVRARAAFLILKNNTDEIHALEAASNAHGTAAEAQEKRLSSLSAQLTIFKNRLGESIVQSNIAQGTLATLTNTIRALNGEAANGGPTLLDGIGKGVEVAIEAIPILGDFYTIIKENGKAERDLASAAEEAQTALNEQAAKVTNSKQTISSLNNEISKLQLRYSDLAKDSNATAAVTAGLTSRFPELQLELNKTTGGVQGLLAAMRMLRTETIQTLQLNQQGQLTATGVIRRQSEANVNQSRRQLGGFADASGNPLVQQIVGLLTTTRGGAARNNDIATGLALYNRAIERGTISKDIIKGLDPLVNSFNKNYQAFTTADTDMRALGHSIAQSRFATRPDSTKMRDVLSSSRDTVSRAIADNEGLDPKTRSANLSKYIGTVRQNLATARERAAIAIKMGDRDKAQYIQQNEVVIAQSTLTDLLNAANPSSKEAKDAAREAKRLANEKTRGARTAQRQRNQFQRNEQGASSGLLSAADKSLSAFLNGQGIGIEINKIPDLLKEGDDLLDKWVQARKNVLTDALGKEGLTPNQMKEMTDAANEEIAAKQKATYDRQVQVIDKAISGFVERQARSIERQFNESIEGPQRNLAIMQGRNAGLDNIDTRSQVPSFTRVISGQRVARAQDDLNRSSIVANDQRINEYQAEIDDLSQAMGDVTAQRDAMFKTGDVAAANAYDDELTKLGATTNDLREKTDQLRTANDALKAQYDTQKTLPQNVGQYIKQSAGAFLVNNNVNYQNPLRGLANTGGEIFNSTLQTASDQLGVALDKIVMKTKSVKDAFKDMGKAVRDAIVEMATKAIATQIFGLLLSFVPGAKVNASGGAGSFPVVHTWRGGLVGNQVPKRLLGGGPVTGGIPTRDSTLVHAAKDEFMIRGSSVKSIGQELLQDMNNRGAAALRGMRGNNIVMPQSSLNSNVYVVLPEEKPSLGPNDVLAIVNRDMLIGGSTKTLVKQISAGG